MSADGAAPRDPAADARRLQREVRRLTYELEVAGKQAPLLRAMIEGCPDALALLSCQGEVLEHNDAFARFVGGPQLHVGHVISECLAREGAAEGRPVAELLDEDRLQRSAASTETLFGSCGDELVEARLCGFERGGERLVVMSLRVLDTATSQQRDLAQTRLQLQRVGGELEAQQQQDEAARLRSLAMLAGSLAHDLNNALAIVTGNLELLKTSVGLGPDAELLEDIGVGARQVGELVHRLHSFSGGANLLRQRFALTKWLPVFARSVANGHSASIEVTVADEPLWVEADEGYLSRVVVNLMVNAVQAAHSLGRSPALRLHIWRQEEGALRTPAARGAQDATRPHAMMSVEDNGAGIEPDAFQQLFVPFHTTKHAGTGLGLAGAARIVELHGGAIGAENVAGGGARFVVALPLVSERDAAPAVTESEGRGHRLDGIEVMLMDDEAKVRLVVERALTAVGAYVECFASGEDIVQAYARSREAGALPVCILDMVVHQGMGGVETVQALRDQWPDARILACTGHANVDLGRSHRELGFDGWLAKPFTIDALRAAVLAVARGSAG